MSCTATQTLLFFALPRLLLLLLLIPESESQFNSPDYVNYTGKRSMEEYPFSRGDISNSCGVCLLQCEDNLTMMSFMGNPDDVNDPCEPPTYSNIYLSFPKHSSISFTILEGFITFINCQNHDNQSLGSGSQNSTTYHHQYWITYRPYNDTTFPEILPPNCSSIRLPILSPKGSCSIQYTLSDQCKRCVAQGGRCHGDNNGEFYCYHKKGKILKPIIYSVLPGLTVIIFILTIYWQTRKTKGSSIFLSRNEFRRENRNLETMLESYAHLTPKRYTHSDIKKMTNSFKEKLGEGGFGGVYKGKLPDGRHVAVKMLKYSKGHKGGFINEVASIGRTNHVNIVTLLGFCHEGHKRALVYEYMANGSLEKFMQGGANNGHSLPLETLFHIVLGIARGLEYLHRGCKTRILHFDIKPHNILLDEELCPKISDFGLAKLTPQDKQSRISMSGTRGTIGYIAPEVFCRTFGDVSHKSDVYSYGMMVLEVIGSRKGANSGAENSSELYFPQYVYKQLEEGEEVEIDINMNENEKQLKRKMIVVSLWCTQPAPSSRPSMSTVVQMLEGSPESIDIPPLPTFSSPPRLQWDPSTSSITTV